ncbi:Glutamine cyclotransferase [Halanaerobium congolense]|uniref:Glutamine cyclotransferase n=1 Tax=Halanaerobium congolense TaxID=54121 RepID=A0A1H9Y6C2_9FIRM|nr:glutaminyl-peptide cyclotransferase [Halanaerobium congolense]PTX16700.1 glutamine cyclotransferase [Halanaerobium congolense]SDE82942.1 Glutamine cyclotransferase [Halanaerobium congolense]SES64442.1 Glutamine cyclotransferase [Halanaerobium congolense]SFO90917.1 Glutamine cyclotransferase [Halanaerobium congolense]
MKSKIKYLVFLLLLFLLTPKISAVNFEEITNLEYDILAEYRHDVEAFTQGLEIHNNYLFEGTGLYGKSSLRKVEIKSGKVLKKINLNKKYFGEGITILNNKIYQLSWKEQTAFVYDLNFSLLNKFKYQGEGWGLTNDGQQLIMSDGSEYIYFRDPDTFQINKIIKVEVNNQSLKNINELEYLNGFIYANIWQKDYILKIDAESGVVKAYLDLSNILDQKYKETADVLNGIAYDPQTETFLVTGKLWPKIYRIKLKNNM